MQKSHTLLHRAADPCRPTVHHPRTPPSARRSRKPDQRNCPQKESMRHRSMYCVRAALAPTIEGVDAGRDTRIGLGRRQSDPRGWPVDGPAQPCPTGHRRSGQTIGPIPALDFAGRADRWHTCQHHHGCRTSTRPPFRQSQTPPHCRGQLVCSGDASDRLPAAMPELPTPCERGRSPDCP